MPRPKPKLAENTLVCDDDGTGQRKRNKNSKASEHEISNENKLVKEELDSQAGGSGGLDLKQFKFEKRPHVRIVFEKDSPVKEVGTWKSNMKFNNFLL